MLRAQDYHSITERLSYRIVTGSDQDMRTLRQLNATIFPIAYHDKFYKDLAHAQGDLCCRAVFILLDGREIIGTFSCRFEAPPESASLDHCIGINQCTYVMTFGLLARYRMRGIGEWMWKMMMEMYADCTKLMVLHVHVGNGTALKFYRKRGFVEQAVVKDYYRRLDPPDAVLLTRLSK